jgi:uncharacterized protein YkwD
MTRELASRPVSWLPPRPPARHRAATLALLVSSAVLSCRGQPEPEPVPEPVVVTPPPTTPPPAAPSRAPARAVGSITDSIFLLTNRERVRADLTPLRRSPELTRAAQVHAEQMASARKLAHDVPGSRYPSLSSRLRFVGYTSTAAGENIAEGYTSGAALVAGWMTSAAHRTNILSARYTETGVGTARS